MRILVTGITGFAGGYLAEALLEVRSNEVFGISRSGTWPLELSHLHKRAELHRADLADVASVEPILRRVQPQQIYHLAGFTNAGRSLREPDEAWNGNLAATRGLYTAIERWGGRPRILFVGSGLVYEAPADPEHAHDEACPLLPTSPYAASKSAADLLSYQMACTAGLEILRARPFNHVGPRQSADFAVAHFCKQIAAAERGERPAQLETGNLAPRRDISDVRDVVRAYIGLMERGRPRESYNVSANVAHAIQELVDRLVAMTPCAIEIRRKSDLVRRDDVAVVRGNASKLRRETGWAPRYTLEQTLADTLDYWRQRR